MRTHALLVGGGFAVSLLLPPTSAHAFPWSFDPFTRQTPAQQVYAGRAHRSEDRGHALQAAYGGQNESRTSAGPTTASALRTRQAVDFPTSHPPGSIVIKTSE